MSNYHLFRGPKQNLCGHKFKALHMGETGVTWWLMNTEHGRPPTGNRKVHLMMWQMIQLWLYLR